MSMMHTQINRPVNSTISERVIPEIQNIVSFMSSGHRDTNSNNHDNRDETKNGFKTKITKNDCRSAFDLRATEDLSPYSKW